MAIDKDLDFTGKTILVTGSGAISAAPSFSNSLRAAPT